MYSLVFSIFRETVLPNHITTVENCRFLLSSSVLKVGVLMTLNRKVILQLYTKLHYKDTSCKYKNMKALSI